jgi:hypothetical protein
MNVVSSHQLKRISIFYLSQYIRHSCALEDSNVIPRKYIRGYHFKDATIHRSNWGLSQQQLQTAIKVPTFLRLSTQGFRKPERPESVVLQLELLVPQVCFFNLQEYFSTVAETVLLVCEPVLTFSMFGMARATS